jgi:membrane associated rhomboid family serine protease
MRCPDCTRERTKTRTLRSTVTDPVVTYAIIALNVLVYLGSSLGGEGLSGGGGSFYVHGALFGPSIAIDHEYWRLITSGFLHNGLTHIAFNMIFVYFLGRILEPVYGHVRFAALYLAALLAGSFGALLFEPNAAAVGASGAAFGLLGAAIVSARKRGIPIWGSGLGITLALNIVITLLVPRISIGAHVGGFLAGLLIGALIEEADRHRGTLARHAPVAGCVVLAVAAVAGAIAISHAAVVPGGFQGLTPGGIGL